VHRRSRRARPCPGRCIRTGRSCFFDLEQRIGKARLDEVLARVAREPRHCSALFLSALRAVAGDAEARAFEELLRR
jgi:hypothetical protein